jgi:hypothetical protein
VITKTEFWKKIQKELKEVERSKRFTVELMNRIKDIPQDEDKTRET